MQWLALMLLIHVVHGSRRDYSTGLSVFLHHVLSFRQMEIFHGSALILPNLLLAT
jgi:hypothetical protein